MNQSGNSIFPFAVILINYLVKGITTQNDPFLLCPSLSLQQTEGFSTPAIATKTVHHHITLLWLKSLGKFYLGYMYIIETNGFSTLIT